MAKAEDIEAFLEDGVLRCAACNSDCLHHGRIEVFNRKEDAQEESVSVVLDNETRIYPSRPKNKVTADVIGQNPSSRRQGLCIYLYCEHCDSTTEMRIAQHKGRTYISVAERGPVRRGLAHE